MSMISGQIDRLRTAAQTYRRLGNHSAESMLLDAADTIWKLRDDLQRTNADNAKLRELVEDMMRYYFMPSAIDSKQRETELLERAHELGVEKDNGELCVEVDA